MTTNDDTLQLIFKIVFITIGVGILSWGLSVDSTARVIGGLGLMFYGGLIGNK